MKTKTISTTKGKFLIVDLPQGAETVGQASLNDLTLINIGFIKDLWESEFIQIVDTNNLHYYTDYLNITKGYLSAEDSFMTLLQLHDILLENPYQQDWDELCEFGHGGFAKDGKTEKQLYDEAEEKVFRNGYIFKLID